MKNKVTTTNNLVSTVGVCEDTQETVEQTPPTILDTPITGAAEFGATLGEAVVGIAEKVSEADGLVDGIDFITYYRLARDN